MRPFKTTPFPLESTFTHTYTYMHISLLAGQIYRCCFASSCLALLTKNSYARSTLACFRSLPLRYVYGVDAVKGSCAVFIFLCFCVLVVFVFVGWVLGGGGGGMLTFIATATTQYVLLHFHTCYAAARSLALPHIRHATLLHCASTLKQPEFMSSKVSSPMVVIQFCHFLEVKRSKMSNNGEHYLVLSSLKHIDMMQKCEKPSGN